MAKLPHPTLPRAAPFEGAAPSDGCAGHVAAAGDGSGGGRERDMVQSRRSVYLNRMGQGCVVGLQRIAGSRSTYYANYDTSDCVDD